MTLKPDACEAAKTRTHDISASLLGTSANAEQHSALNAVNKVGSYQMKSMIRFDSPSERNFQVEKGCWVCRPPD